MFEPNRLARLPKSHTDYSAYYEMLVAGRWENYKWSEFKKLSGQDKAEIIMAYRASNLLEAIISEEQAEDSAKASSK